MGLMILDTLWKLRREHLHSIASSSSSSSSSSHETMFMTFSVCISLHALSVFCEKKFNKPTKVWLQLECAGRVHMHKTPVNKALKIWAFLQRVCCCCRKCVPFFVWTRSFITHTRGQAGCTNSHVQTQLQKERRSPYTHTHTHTHTHKMIWFQQILLAKRLSPRTSLHRHSPEWTNN
jgi:hypothetical protein